MLKSYFHYFIPFIVLTFPLHAELTSNRITLDSYELSVEKYIENTSPEYCSGFNDWIRATLRLIPKNAQIIEIGSAFGRDADYIESQGYIVERTDATKGFVDLLEETGYSARLFNILEDSFSTSYDLVFANRVFLHFTPNELAQTLDKVKDCLKENGILSFSLKIGEGEEWSEEKLGKPRYYCYWNAKQIRSLLESKGFDVLSISEKDKFLEVIAQSSSLLNFR